MAIVINGSTGITTPDVTSDGLTVDTTTLVVDDTNNRVGIGTASPGRTLDVSGSIRSGGSTNPYFALNNGTVESYLEITSSNTRLSAGGANAITMFTNSAERIRIDSDGLKFNGDTAAANALDDFEEGTWTAVLEGASGNPSGTYSNQAGRYTKIGRTVFVAFQIVLNSGFSAGSGSIRISGLPFTSNFEVFGGNFCQEYNTNSYCLNHASMHISNNVTYMDMFFNRQNDGFTTYKWADINTGATMYLYGSLTYQVA